MTTIAQQQLQRPLGQQQSAGLVLQQQTQAQQQLANPHLLNDPNRMAGMYGANPAAGLTQTAAGQVQQQQQSMQQQQMIQQATAQLQQQQSIIQHQHQQLLMMNSTNQEFMQMQHQAQHSKKLRKMTGPTTALEQQQMMV